MKKLIALFIVLAALFSFTAYAKELDIGIVLPTKEEDRWLADEAKFKELIEKNGYKAEIMYSQASSAIEKTNVESLVVNGIKVLILCPFDMAAAASTVEMAKADGVQIISYDRLIMDTDAIDFAQMTGYSLRSAEPLGAGDERVNGSHPVRVRSPLPRSSALRRPGHGGSVTKRNGTAHPDGNTL